MICKFMRSAVFAAIAAGLLLGGGTIAAQAGKSSLYKTKVGGYLSMRPSKQRGRVHIESLIDIFYFKGDPVKSGPDSWTFERTLNGAIVCRVFFTSRAKGKIMNVEIDQDTPCTALGSGHDVSGNVLEFHLQPGQAGIFND